jgi:hypothetical protein
MAYLSLEEFLSSEFQIALYCERNPPRNGNPATTHSGIISKLEGIEKFHFAWHHDLRHQEFIPNNRSIYIGLPQFSKATDQDLVNGKTFLRNIRSVCKNPHNKTIAYGLQFHRLMTFGSGNAFILNDGKAVGLTCSTFIMVVFQRFDDRLIAEETWQPRKEDAEWKESVLRYMREDNTIPFAHIQKIEQEEVVYRFKPEEVVSSPLSFPNVADFDTCVTRGRKIIQILEAYEE